MKTLHKCERDVCSNTTTNAKFCSRKCSVVVTNVASPKRRANVKRCPSCLEEFQSPPSSKQQFCSKKCGYIDALKYTTEDLFIENCPVNRSVVKAYLLRWEIFELKCTLCSITEWQGVPAPIELDHVNGVNNDNRIENLRMLCANCHAIQSTNGWKNAHRKKRSSILR